MCYAIYLASPLTLSEVRSMLPPGLAVDLLLPEEQEVLQRQYPAALTVGRILRGGCACDFIMERDPARRSDESHLRARCSRLKLSRDRTIAALEAHRRAADGRIEPPAHWTRALAAFVAEHARNAGPTLYYHHFSPEGLLARPPEPQTPLTIPASQVRAAPDSWLPEDRLVLVVR